MGSNFYFSDDNRCPKFKVQIKFRTHFAQLIGQRRRPPAWDHQHNCISKSETNGHLQLQIVPRRCSAPRGGQKAEPRGRLHVGRLSRPALRPFDAELVEAILQGAVAHPKHLGGLCNHPVGTFHRLQDQIAFEMLEVDAFGRDLEAIAAARAFDFTGRLARRALPAANRAAGYVSPSHSRIARSIADSSWRTLPGHG